MRVPLYQPKLIKSAKAIHIAKHVYPDIEFVKDGLVAQYLIDEGTGQVLNDSSGNNNHGQLGSTIGVDPNDPSWDGQGLSFIADDYVKLPYMINVNNDFTVYLAVNVKATTPTSNEAYLSFGNSLNEVPYVMVYRTYSGGGINCYFRYDTNTSGHIDIINPHKGIGLFVLKRKNNDLFLKDVVGTQITSITLNNNFTLDQISLGCTNRTNATSFLNDAQYYVSFYNRATTDTEDQQEFKAIRRELLARGAILN